MSWIQEYFVAPILANGWFNPVNTAVYSIGLIIGVYLVYRLLLKLKVEISGKFFLAILPFIFWASSTRILHDAAVAGALSPALNALYLSPIFPTPGSYFITFGFALATLLASLLVQKYTGYPYWKPMFAVGAAFSLLNVSMIPWVSLLPFLVIVPVALFWTGLLALPNRVCPSFFNKVNIGILSAHFLDASATFFALSSFGYLEQHVLPRLAIGIIGPVSMFPVKIAVVLPVLYIIDRYGKDSPKSFVNFIKIVVLILGLAPGLRDLMRLMAGV